MQGLLSPQPLSPRKETPKIQHRGREGMLRTGSPRLMANTVITSMRLASEPPSFLEWHENRAKPHQLS